MTSAVTQFIQKHVATRFPHLRVRGRLLYHRPADRLLRGFWIESSAFSAARFYVTAFVQSMAVPAEHLDLSWGHRLGDGAESSWELGKENDIELAADIVPRMQHEDGQFLSRIRGLGEFVELVSSLSVRRGDLRATEAQFYALTLLGNLDRAAELVDRIGYSDGQPGWQRELIDRLKAQAAMARKDFQALIREIERQEENTRRAIRVE